MKKSVKISVILFFQLTIALFAFHSYAQNNQSNSSLYQAKEITTSQAFGEYTIHFNVFNSKTIPAEIAERYKLKRGANTAIVNIGLTKKIPGQQGQTLGQPAKISGKATNLMQQTSTLNFAEVQEGDPQSASGATYYLASFYYINEEDIHFNITVSPADNPAQRFEVSFSRRLYSEN